MVQAMSPPSINLLNTASTISSTVCELTSKGMLCRGDKAGSVQKKTALYSTQKVKLIESNNHRR